MPIKATRALLTSALNGSLKSAEFRTDANFGFEKYDYFRLLHKDGRTITADPEHSSVKKNVAFAKAGERTFELRFEELANWSRQLKSSEMDMSLQQRYGRITLIDNGKAIPGIAIAEYGIGTLG